MVADDDEILFLSDKYAILYFNQEPFFRNSE